MRFFLTVNGAYKQVSEKEYRKVYPQQKTTTISIINKATFEDEYAHQSGSSLIFEADLFDCTYYVDKTKLRKTLNLKGRGKILHILVRRNDDPLFVNVANKDVKYKTPVNCVSTMDGASPCEYISGNWTTKHPIGNVIVVLSE